MLNISKLTVLMQIWHLLRRTLSTCESVTCVFILVGLLSQICNIKQHTSVHLSFWRHSELFSGTPMHAFYPVYNTFQLDRLCKQINARFFFVCFLFCVSIVQNYCITLTAFVSETHSRQPQIHTRFGLIHFWKVTGAFVVHTSVYNATTGVLLRKRKSIYSIVIIN